MNMHLAVAVIGAGFLAAQPLMASAESPALAMEITEVQIAALPAPEAELSAPPLGAMSDSEDGAARRIGPDPSRSQSLARALLFLMTGGSGSRPFPLIPR